MIRFEIPYYNVESDYDDKASEFIHLLRISTSRYNNIRVEDIKWEYSCGFFYKEPKTEDEFIDYDIMENDKLSLKFPERLEYELEKLRVYLVMTAGDFMVSDKVIGIPDEVISVASEVVKIMMYEEQKDIKDREIVISIPPIRIDIPEIVIEDIYDDVIIKDNEPLSVDKILDKINLHGIDSLTSDDYRFLDSQ